MSITPITDSTVLAEFCAGLVNSTYITIDTEFIRDKTYWSKLCLIQIAGPSDAAVIDALAPGIDLSPVDELLDSPNILKVFHAGRQDIEIFFNRTGRIPAPMFDSQIAAMVCGFGDQVGYEPLIAKLVGKRVDKSSRFTDWSHRPLTQKQLAYALSDVTHLRVAYEKLSAKLEKSGRASWLQEEMQILSNPDTYRLDPDTAWQRIKSRNSNPRFHAILRELAKWRETEAQRRDIPRNRILRDDALLEIASQAPKNPEALGRLRGLPKGQANGSTGAAIIESVKAAEALPEEELPVIEVPEKQPPNLGPTTDLLRVLLKYVSEKNGVAVKLIASADDLQRVAASDDADIPALKGWRYDLFGEKALALKHGRLAIMVAGKQIKLLRVDQHNNQVASG